ncbi:hypothetical protein WJX84_012201 [Apatococcus fuscideae]|uniref:Uncharacterized protein n=1 Tax=Apatococcus fuscideae TaxID=2026836 RepID=A0AAW1SZA4_9CHLO
MRSLIKRSCATRAPLEDADESPMSPERQHAEGGDPFMQDVEMSPRAEGDAALENRSGIQYGGVLPDNPTGCIS